MILVYRYIDVEDNGRVQGSRLLPLETSIDTEGMIIPNQPTDAVYDLYYNEADGLHWVKVADFEEESTEPTQLDRIEEQVNNIANGATAEATEVMNALLGVE